MAKVWIYQADRFLTDKEVSEITDKIDVFTLGWNAHGSSLAGKGYIRDNLFVIFEVNESEVSASGCSIDKSVAFLKEIEKQYNISLFDRYRVAYQDERGRLKQTDKKDFESLIKSGKVTEKTIVYNNTVTTSEEMKTKWNLPFKDSWHARVF
ncbi:MAG TPA: hypothetical protein VK102_06450 [Sphingobacterium sp.]|nr:hypothetical protein [Sphingobacterium sp.]